MANASMGNNISHYNQVNRVSGITDADPHRLVLMLLEGALGKIATVKGLIMRKDIPGKGEVIGQAIAIIGGLKSSLNKEAGGEIAVNLDNLYEYIERRLIQANMKNDLMIIDEVVSLLHEIKTAWESIPLESRTKPSAGLSAIS
ncbi:MAG: flagellar export chaperone FliS [Gammaproteobacteria bacterium]